MITLYRSGQFWMADYSKAPAEQQALILDVMGSLQLPCAFGAQADASLVQSTIQRLNPAQRVMLRAE